MNHDQFQRVAGAFATMAELPEDQRATALQELARTDPSIAAEVAALLRHDRPQDPFLSKPALGARIDIWAARTQQMFDEDLSGQQIGHYRLVRKIAVGGMGAVYLAQRADGQFEREVAIKLIKRGLDTDEVLRRFQHERQTLAALEHPGIARLLDGGATETGRPYLLMEYVQGQAIDAYCREQSLSIDARIALFLQVCDAVHHAHQNLVIHRDIKPQNVLVSLDGRPKLVDFGVAKVLNSAPETGLTTEVGTRFTPEYASPEQVLGQAVTTATDVYSLGVLLYEMLAGNPPYTFQRRTQEELRQLVCEREPQPPSTHNPEVAEDLDRIVLMAMRKEPHRRYASVREFANDLLRFKRGLPVHARPTTVRYVLAKFVRRNRAGVAAASLLALLAVAAVGAIAWQSRETARQRDLAVTARDEAQAVTTFLTSMLAQADPGNAGPDLKVREFLDTSAARAQEELADKPRVRAAVLDAMALTYLNLGLLEQADTLVAEVLPLREARADVEPGTFLDSLMNLATLRFHQRRFPEAEEALRRAETVSSRFFGPRHAKTAHVLSSLGPVLRNQGKTEEAEAVLNLALAIRREVLGPESAEVAETINNLSLITAMRGDLPGTEALLRQALAIREKKLDPDHPMLTQAKDNLAVVLLNQRKVAEARPLLEASLAAARRRYPADHPSLSIHLHNSAGALVLDGQFEEAISLAREAMAIRVKHFGETDINTLNTASTVAYALLGAGRGQEGEELLLSFWEMVKSQPGTPPWRAMLSHFEGFYYRSGNEEKAAEFREIAGSAP